MSEKAASKHTKRDHPEEKHYDKKQSGEMKDKPGLTALITGATSGIGYVTALELARKGMHVVLHARNPEKAEQVRSDIERSTGNGNLDVLLADFTSLDEVRRAAAEFRETHGKLDILVNNAGLILGKQRLESAEGYEQTITINHLAPFLLTSRLFDLLTRSDDGRIINVASEAHRGASPDFSDFHMKKSYSGWKAYCNSKLYNIMFTDELARRVGGANRSDDAAKHISTWSLHPGTVATNFSYSAGGLTNMVFRIFRPFLRTAENGAATSVYLAAEPDIPASNGAYFIDRKQARVRHGFFTHKNNRMLWERSCELTGEDFLAGQ